MTKKPHVHHIIPKWRCKELNIDPNFKGNVVITSHEQHIKIHLGYHKKDLKPLLEVCNPSEEILKLLKLGDNNDFKAACILSNGSQIPVQKHGLLVGDRQDKSVRHKYMKKYYNENREEILKKQKLVRTSNPEKYNSYQRKMRKKFLYKLNRAVQDLYYNTFKRSLNDRNDKTNRIR